MQEQELRKLLSIYKNCVAGELSIDTLKDEMLNTQLLMDRMYAKGKDIESLVEYYIELQEIAFKMAKVS